MEQTPCQHHGDHNQRKSVMLKDEAGLDCDIEFTASSGWFKPSKSHYSLHNVKLSGESVSGDLKAAGKCLETKEADEGRNSSIWMKTLYSGNRFLKGLSIIGR